MDLYAVVVKGVYPPQIVNIYDVKENAEKVKNHIISELTHLKNDVEIDIVDSFFPRGYCEADANVNRVVKEFQQTDKF